MEKSTLSIKETLSITFRTLKILFHAAPGGIAFLGILSTIAGVCPFLTLILSRAFLDSLARACGQQAFEMKIIWLLFFLFLTNMMLSVVNNLSILLKSDVSGRISLLVNAQVLEKCVHLPMSQYDNETTYNRIRFTSEQTSIRCTNLINTFFSIVQCLISFASVVCVLVSFNGIIVIASVVASIPLFFVNKYVSSFWYKISVGRVEKQRYSDVLRDLMLRNDNIKELKLFGSLSYLKSRILNQQTDFFREDQMNRKKFCKIDTAQKAANDFVILLLKLWIIILGIKQRATLGTINLYTSSLDQIQSAIFSFCTQLNTFYEQALYLESLFDLFDMQTEDENCGTPLTEPIRTIEFRHVYFSYPATNVYALKNVSFVLDDRHTYALIGLNGSGKTTLLKLLMKLYKPTLGTILINGQDIEEIDTAGLRKRISAIFQDFIKYTAAGSADQRLKVHKVSGGCQLLSDLNNAYGLNIYGTKAGSVCDFYPVSGNFNDALIDLLTVDAANNLYRIKMINHNLYLTPASNSSGAALTWENASNADNQIWQLCASQSSGGGSTGGSTTITMPVNANQNYSGNSSWIINYGCAVCCGVDLASWKKNKSYTISDFANYYDETNGYYWTGPDNFSCSDAISLASLNEAQTIEKIRSYVKNHIPVACHAVGSGSRQHWFVAYELTGESGGTWATAGIKVLDPYNSNSGSTEGRRVTILEAMQTSHVTLGVDRIRIPN